MPLANTQLVASLATLFSFVCPSCAGNAPAVVHCADSAGLDCAPIFERVHRGTDATALALPSYRSPVAFELPPSEPLQGFVVLSVPKLPANTVTTARSADDVGDLRATAASHTYFHGDDGGPSMVVIRVVAGSNGQDITEVIAPESSAVVDGGLVQTRYTCGHDDSSVRFEIRWLDTASQLVSVEVVRQRASALDLREAELIARRVYKDWEARERSVGYSSYFMGTRTARANRGSTTMAPAGRYPALAGAEVAAPTQPADGPFQGDDPLDAASDDVPGSQRTHLLRGGEEYAVADDAHEVSDVEFWHEDWTNVDTAEALLAPPTMKETSGALWDGGKSPVLSGLAAVMLLLALAQWHLQKGAPARCAASASTDAPAALLPSRLGKSVSEADAGGAVRSSGGPGGSSSGASTATPSEVPSSPSSLHSAPSTPRFAAPGQARMRPQRLPVSSVQLLFASPLVDAKTDEALAPIGVLKELEVVAEAFDECSAAPPAVSRRVATADNFRALLSAPSRQPARAAQSIVHLAAHGYQRTLWLEDQFGAKASLDGVHSLDIASGGSPAAADCGGVPRQVALAFLHVCHAHEVADRLVKSGVRHVVAATDSVAEKPGLVFVRSFYKALAQGETVRVAYETTLATWHAEFPLQSSCPFVLLPANNPNAVHDVALFEAAPEVGASPGHANVRALRALERALPPLPEDFCGRAAELHRLLTLVTDRRQTQLVDFGPLGGPAGKSALAAALVRHINLRAAPFTAAAYVEAPTSLPQQLLLQALLAALRAAPCELRAACELVERQLARVGEARNVPALVADTVREVVTMPGVRKLLIVVDSQAHTLPESVVEDLREMQLPPQVHLLLVARAPSQGGGGGSLFKKTVFELAGLQDRDAGVLFLRRAPRAVTAGDIGLVPAGHANAATRLSLADAAAVARSPLLSHTAGVPARVIECSEHLDRKAPRAKAPTLRSIARDARHRQRAAGV